MPIIGIDLGTTNSLTAVWRDGESILIPNVHGKLLTPSVVGMDEDGSILVGEAAKQRLVSHPAKTASLFKQFMGSPKTYPLGGRTFRPEELSAMILRSLKRDAEVFLGEEVTEAIISVPAYFNDAQRSATKNAGQLAGLKVDRILNEPSAAALAYRRRDLRDGTSLVFDFGGGTLDISVLESFENIVDILAVSGDNHLGGSDMDEAIVEAFLRANPDLKDKLTDRQRSTLLQMAEDCKITLTDKPNAFMVYERAGESYTLMLDNKTLTRICAPLLIRFKDVLQHALLDAQRPLSAIHHLILVGGSCRMPLVREYLRHLTQREVLCDLDPDHVVALGVGVAAGIKERNQDVRDMVLTDICPFSLGVNSTHDGKLPVFSPIIQRNCALPASHTKRYVTISENQTEMLFQIYQGESMDPAKNLLLGSTTVPLPALPKGEAMVEVRFTYDINGILDIDFTCQQSGYTQHKLIVSNNCLSPEEINTRLAALERLKTVPRDLEENRLLLARGARLFEEFSGELRERIGACLLQFEAALADGKNPAHTAKLREDAKLFFDRLDEYRDNLLVWGYAPYEEPDDEDDDK